MRKILKAMVSLDEYQCENEKKSLQKPDKTSSICKDNKYFIYTYVKLRLND